MGAAPIVESRELGPKYRSSCISQNPRRPLDPGRKQKSVPFEHCKSARCFPRVAPRDVLFYFKCLMLQHSNTGTAPFSSQSRYPVCCPPGQVAHWRSRPKRRRQCQQRPVATAPAAATLAKFSKFEISNVKRRPGSRATFETFKISNFKTVRHQKKAAATPCQRRPA